MALFAVGDIQGCYTSLRQLLDLVRFEPSRDRLLLTGDLVNRGPRSLEVLRHVRALGDAATTVLGNHDLHLLAVAHGGSASARDTFDDVLQAPDRDELIDWLLHRPLAYQEPVTGTLLVHAGLLPQWSVQQTLALAAEFSAAITRPPASDFFRSMYGNQPDRWDDALQGESRLRCIVNALTRLRYCTRDGRMDLKAKGAPGTQPAGLVPWFEAPGRLSAGSHIVCGHWSTLSRVRWPESRLHALDTGCVWGGSLSALDLESGQLHSVSCEQMRKPGAESD